MDKVGGRIKQLRNKRNLTLQELGEKINFNYSNLSKIERGERKPTLELLEQLADFFDVKVAYFFGEEQPLPRELVDRGVEWMTFGEEMEKRNLTPEELKRMVEFLDNFNKDK